MKLIIIEGQDNLGKTTIIREIIKDYKSYIVRKFSNPPKLSPEFQDNFQQQSFLNEFRFYVSMCKLELFDHENTVMIWDRSHLGEQVYGPLYRGTNPTHWLNELEKLFLPELDASLILLEGNPDFVLKNEDGQSLTMSGINLRNFLNIYRFQSSIIAKIINQIGEDENLTKAQKVKRIENELFKYAFHYSLINKKIIVNVEDNNQFRPLTEIMNEVNQFLK